MFKKIYNIILYTFAIIGFILIAGFILSKTRLTDKAGITDADTDYYNKSRSLNDNNNYIWLNTEEYLSLKDSIKAEQTVLERVEKETGIKPRLLVSILFVEQMRLFTDNREIFKKVFEPLKILGIQSQFSWGILGLKQDTLIQIENNEENEKKLLFTTDNHDEERFMRVTDEHNHYYSYLYAALFIKQIEKQWQNAGFDISNRPEILTTLYNIGFTNSKPKEKPQVGGAEIDIAGQIYSFGGLAYEFYNSNELLEQFPR